MAVGRPAARAGAEPAAALADPPLVTVDILAYNRREELAVTLDALRAADYPRERLQVVVVDNASSDGTADLVRERYPEVELIERPANAGISGWNDGFARARGEYVLVLDDDCYVTGDAIARAVAAAREHDADLVSVSVASEFDRSFRFEHHYATGLLAFWGCAALVSRRALDRLGGYDANIFLWGHEVEFTIRLLDAGLTHLFLPDVTAVHIREPGDDLSDFRRRTNLRNLAYVAARYLRPVHAAGAVVNLALGSVVGAAKGSPRFALDLRWVAAGALRGGRNRRPVRRRVSALYRRNFIDFLSPLRFGRRPRELVAHTAAAETVASRRAAFWEARPQLYPRTRAALRI